MKNSRYELLRDISEGVFFAEGDRVCPAHFHSKIEILYVTLGEKTVYINGEELHAKEDNIVVSLGYDAHQYISGEGSEQIVLTIPAEMIYGYYERFSKFSLASNLLADKEKARALLPLIQRIGEAEDEYIAASYATALMAELSFSLGLCEKSSERPPFIKEILIYIEENYRDEITIGDLARRFGFSRNYMSHLFNSMLGATFTDYLNFVRTRHAAAEIRARKGSITEICYSSGFSSISSFYRAFKKQYGTSPKKFI